MSPFEWLHHLMGYPVLGPWWYTLGRTALLLAALLTLRRVRGWPWPRWSLTLASTALALQVLSDLGTDGADGPYTPYLIGIHLALVLLLIGVGRMVNNAHAIRDERDMALDQVKRLQWQVDHLNGPTFPGGSS